MRGGDRVYLDDALQLLRHQRETLRLTGAFEDVHDLRGREEEGPLQRASARRCGCRDSDCGWEE